MRYTPNTEAERRAMMDVIGIEDVAELFTDIPAEHRFPDLQLPDPLTEMEVVWEMNELAGENATMSQFPGRGRLSPFRARCG